MGRGPAYPPHTKARIVEWILSVQTSTAQAGRDYQVSQTAINQWKQRYLEAARTGLEAGMTPDRLKHLAQLEADNDALKERLLEAEILIQIWQMSAPRRQPDRHAQPSLHIRL